MPGFDTFQQGGDVIAVGDAARLASGLVGDGMVSFGIYRVALGGDEPGVVAVDVNLLPDTNGARSNFWVGVSNYGTDSWDWAGPCTDGHTRLSLPTGIHTSPFGNLFVCCVAYDGCQLDVIGVGAIPRSEADPDLPPQPSAPAVTGIVNGLMLEWFPVIAGDLAGYRIYYCGSDFTSEYELGVQSCTGLEGLTRHILTNLQGTTFVRIAAVDFAGNESPLSDLAVGDPLPGQQPELQIMLDMPNCQRGDSVAITAQGADTYDLDINGDGFFDITGDSTGSALVDTSYTGIIRPQVRGIIGDASCVACSSVSLVVSGNSRPVASCTANPQSGQAPLIVGFTGEGVDFDGAVTAYRWDFDGDGIYDYADFTNPIPPNQSYTTPGVYNIKFRVEDDGGAWDVDTVTIVVSQGTGGPNNSPTPDLQVNHAVGDAPHRVMFDASGSTDSDGSIILYEWDFEDDGCIDGSANYAYASHTYPEAGIYNAYVYVTDDKGAQTYTSVQVQCNGWVTDTIVSADEVINHTAIAQVSGNPAVLYIDNTSGKAKYVRAGDATGGSWLNPVELGDGFPGSFFTPQIVIVNGNPAVLYMDNNGLAAYQRAIDPFGYTWTTPINPLPNANQSYSVCLTVVDGNPAISCTDMGDSRLRFIRATDTNGTTWGSPIVVDGTTTTASDTSMVVSAGLPAIAYVDTNNNYLKFVCATNAAGTAWDTPVTIDDVHIVLSGARMTLAYNSAAVADAPVIAYMTTDWSDFTVWSVYAYDAAGTSWSSPQEHYTGGNIDQRIGIVRENQYDYGVAFSDIEKLDLKYGIASDGYSFPVTTIETFGPDSMGLSVAMLQNSLGISHVAGGPSNDLLLTSRYK